MTFVLVLISYLLGATPTSFLVGKVFYGVDLREKGSGNLGATNTFRVLGAKAAVPVAVVDVLKGWLPAWWFHQLDGSPVWAWAVAYGGAAIVGHVFSLWVRFRGGKGIATSAGVFLALAPVLVGVALVVWLLTVLTTRIVSLGSILGVAAAAVAGFLLPDVAPVLRWFTVGLAVFVVWAHRANVGRLLRGEELAFRKGGDSSPGSSASPADGTPAGDVMQEGPSS